MRDKTAVRGIAGDISEVSTQTWANDSVLTFAEVERTSKDIDLEQMAQWALNYLCRTPKRDFNFEPVFQCHPLRLPPVPDRPDVVVACDTDARMDWEWYYMREVSESQGCQEVEEAFHKRMLEYIDPEGRVWAHPGCFNENKIDARYTEDDYVIHIWGATKILKSLSLRYEKRGDNQAKALARRVMDGLKEIATWNQDGTCYIRCGMGALRRDGSIVPNFWNKHPAPLVQPLVTYWLATGDNEGLEFAVAYANGILNHAQPDGMTFGEQGEFEAHGHATMHTIWGIARLGLETGDARYIEFAKKTFDYMASLGTGTGWFPAMPILDNCNETCLISDMISVASILGEWGYSEYFDYAERYFRNYIHNLQFFVTPEFADYYRGLHQDAGAEAVEAALAELRKFQGGVIGGSGLNDYENHLLGGTSGFEMFGCCAPEGMRAIHTVWSHIILPARTGSNEVCIHMNFNHSSESCDVVSLMPERGGTIVKAKVAATFLIRVPHWAPHLEVALYINGEASNVTWRGDYVQVGADAGDEIAVNYPLVSFVQRVSGLWPKTAPDLELVFRWLGNMVVEATPPAKDTPLYIGRPRQLPALDQQSW